MHKINTVLFIETWLYNPHIETAFEIAKRHLDNGDKVIFYFAGHDLPYQDDGISSDLRIIAKRRPSQLPERKLAKLIRNQNLKFYPSVRSKEVNIENFHSFDCVSSLISCKYKGSNIGLATYSSLIHQTKHSNPDLSHYIAYIQSMLCSGAQAYDLASLLIKKHKPDLMYVFNGRFVNCRSIMEAAIHNNIPLQFHERGCNKDHFSVNPYMPHDISKVQESMVNVWQEKNTQNPDSAIVAHKFFRDRRNGKELDWFSFTSKQIKGELPSLDTNSQTIISYFTSSDDEFKAVGDIVKWKYWKDQWDAVQDLIDVCRKMSNVHLVVRVHPHFAKKNPADQEAWLSIECNDNITIIPAESTVDSYALIDFSDVVVTCGSTVGIESVYWHTPSICLGPSVYSDLNAVYEPRSKDELIALIANAKHLAAEQNLALPYGYYFSTVGERFIHYNAHTLASGEFMGVDVRRIDDNSVPRKITTRCIRFLSRLKAKTLQMLIKA